MNNYIGLVLVALLLVPLLYAIWTIGQDDSRQGDAPSRTPATLDDLRAMARRTTARERVAELPADELFGQTPEAQQTAPASGLPHPTAALGLERFTVGLGRSVTDQMLATSSLAEHLRARRNVAIGLAGLNDGGFFGW